MHGTLHGNFKCIGTRAELLMEMLCTRELACETLRIMLLALHGCIIYRCARSTRRSTEKTLEGRRVHQLYTFKQSLVISLGFHCMPKNI